VQVGTLFFVCLNFFHGVFVRFSEGEFKNTTNKNNQCQNKIAKKVEDIFSPIVLIAFLAVSLYDKQKNTIQMLKQNDLKISHKKQKVGR
jgi:hypothetical protein